MCAFTHANRLAELKSSYYRRRTNVETLADTNNQNDAPNSMAPRRSSWLEIQDRASGRLLLGPVDLETESGREALALFVSNHAGTPVECVTSPNGDFQFGNTSSGIKLAGDAKARSMHVSTPHTQTKNEYMNVE